MGEILIETNEYKLQRDILEKDEKAEKMLVELNEGAHFDNTNERVVKGIKWQLVL